MRDDVIDDPFDIDFGESGNRPEEYVTFKSHTQEWLIGRSNERRIFEQMSVHGVLLDIYNLRSGWVKDKGERGKEPTFWWNPNPRRFEPQPDPDAKQIFHIPVFFRIHDNSVRRAVWEAETMTAIRGFENLRDNLRPQFRGNEGKLPVIRAAGCETMSTKRGAFNVPMFEIRKWAERPDDDIVGMNVPASEVPAEAPVQQAPPPPVQPVQQPQQRAPARPRQGPVSQAVANASNASQAPQYTRDDDLDDEIPF